MNKKSVFCLCILFLNTLDAESRLPIPGKLVDIGDCKMHIYCTGKACVPTVILDACLGGNSFYWSLVQPQVAQFVHVCSFDRVGLGLSSDNGQKRTSKNMVSELHMLLQKSGVKGPYILVGHSSGGINMRLYANTYPDEVYGVILVDASHEDQRESFKKIDKNFSIEQEIVWPSMLPQSVQEKLALYNIPAEQKAGADEWACFSESMQELKDSQNQLLDRPLIVITACKKREDMVELELQKARMREYDRVWQDFQKDFLKLSRKSTQTFADKSGHFVMFDQPKVVIDAIHAMVEQYHKNLVIV